MKLPAQGVNIFISNPRIVFISKYLLGPRRRGPRWTELINTGQRTESTEAYTGGGGGSAPRWFSKIYGFQTPTKNKKCYDPLGKILCTPMRIKLI